MAGRNTAKILSREDMEEGKKINAIFENLSEEGKIMAVTYISALRDKETLARRVTEKVG